MISSKKTRPYTWHVLFLDLGSLNKNLMLESRYELNFISTEFTERFDKMYDYASTKVLVSSKRFESGNENTFFL